MRNRIALQIFRMANPHFLPHEIKALDELIPSSIPTFENLSEAETEAISNFGVLKSKGHYYLGERVLKFHNKFL